MSFKCEVSNLGSQFGNNVSHSNRKTRKKFKPNLCQINYQSSHTRKSYSLRVSSSCIRNIDKAGGFDSYIINAKTKNLSPKALKIKKEILAEKLKKTKNTDE